MENSACHNTIESAWRGDASLGDLAHVMAMLNNCSKELQVWSKISFGSVRNNLNQARHHLKILVQAELKHSRVEEQKMARREVQSWLKKEEMMWYQRLKVLW